jgi:hypothetical protein
MVRVCGLGMAPAEAPRGVGSELGGGGEGVGRVARAGRWNWIGGAALATKRVQGVRIWRCAWDVGRHETSGEEDEDGLQRVGVGAVAVGVGRVTCQRAGLAGLPCRRGGTWPKTARRARRGRAGRRPGRPGRWWAAARNGPDRGAGRACSWRSRTVAVVREEGEDDTQVHVHRPFTTACACSRLCQGVVSASAMRWLGLPQPHGSNTQAIACRRADDVFGARSTARQCEVASTSRCASRVRSREVTAERS